jgi:polyisoprenoid-binding protein YceI
MKFARLAATLACGLAIPALAETETFNVDPQHTFPAYEIGHFGYSIQRGRFNKTQGKIAMDPAAKTGSAEISIDAASVSTGVAKLDEHLRGDDFFDAAKNPQITFKSNELTFDGERVRQARGTLTIAGVAKPITFEVTHFKCGIHPLLMRKVCGAELTANIKRSDFGMKYALPMLADEVVLRVNVEAIKDS